MPLTVQGPEAAYRSTYDSLLHRWCRYTSQLAILSPLIVLFAAFCAFHAAAASCSTQCHIDEHDGAFMPIIHCVHHGHLLMLFRTIQ